MVVSQRESIVLLTLLTTSSLCSRTCGAHMAGGGDASFSRIITSALCKKDKTAPPSSAGYSRASKARWMTRPPPFHLINENDTLDTESETVGSYSTRRQSSLQVSHDGQRMVQQVAAVAVKERKRKATKRRLKLPNIPVGSFVGGQLKGSGIYYGISPQTFDTAASKNSGNNKKSMTLSESMMETLEELRIMRQEMEVMRKEMQKMKRKMIADGDYEEEEEEGIDEGGGRAKKALRKRQREFEKIAAEVEQWATKILYEETEENGWKEVACNKMMDKLLNGSGRTRAYIKWMPDSRGDYADTTTTTKEDFPCIKVFSTIDAPLEDVCMYLSQESAAPEYNDLVVNHKDVEEILPHCKICWSQSPQILFIKPRDFVTFCHHRWKQDGTQVIINQACDHPEYPATKQEKEGKCCRAYALRGANFISRCPDDPEKTRIAIVAHADPGGNVPKWACKTAVNALAPIEPFKLFHRINENVKRTQTQLREKLRAQAEMVSTLPGGRTPNPGGIAQLGYACYWPNGGGLKEPGFNSGSNKSQTVDGEMSQSEATEGDAQWEEEGVTEQSTNSEEVGAKVAN